MGKQIQFQVGPHDRLFADNERVRAFSEGFVRKITAKGKLELDSNDIRVTWPPSMKGSHIGVEIVFLFDDKEWIRDNLPKILETVFLIFKRSRTVNKCYSLLTIRYESVSGFRKYEVREFDLRRKYNEQSEPKEGKIVKLRPDYDD